jgi:hypothetical protein
VNNFAESSAELVKNLPLANDGPGAQSVEAGTVFAPQPFEGSGQITGRFSSGCPEVRENDIPRRFLYQVDQRRAAYLSATSTE